MHQHLPAPPQSSSQLSASKARTKETDSNNTANISTYPSSSRSAVEPNTQTTTPASLILFWHDPGKIGVILWSNESSLVVLNSEGYVRGAVEDEVHVQGYGKEDARMLVGYLRRLYSKGSTQVHEISRLVNSCGLVILVRLTCRIAKA